MKNSTGESPSTKGELEGVQKFLEEVYIRGQVPPSAYYKNLLVLASDWIRTHHDAERALILLNRVPPAYFLGPCVGQANDDIFFREALVELSRTLVQFGYGPDGSPPATLPEARA